MSSISSSERLHNLLFVSSPSTSLSPSLSSRLLPFHFPLPLFCRQISSFSSISRFILALFSPDCLHLTTHTSYLHVSSWHMLLSFIFLRNGFDQWCFWRLQEGGSGGIFWSKEDIARVDSLSLFFLLFPLFLFGDKRWVRYVFLFPALYLFIHFFFIRLFVFFSCETREIDIRRLLFGLLKFQH